MKFKIEEIFLRHLRIPMVEKFKISSGEVSVKDSIIVEVKFSDGFTGYGEASPMAGSFYSSETPESVWDELIDCVNLIGNDFDFENFETEVDKLNSKFSSYGLSSFARAGIETALWDAFSKIRGQPIYKLISAEFKKIESGLAVGICDNVSELLSKIEKYLSDGGYKRVKIKVQKGWDIEPLKEIRKNFGDIPLMVDANCAYTSDDIEHLKKFDEFGLIMIEQPFGKSDIKVSAILQRQISTPICFDESADTIENLKIAFELGACKVVNIKIQRVGGILNAKRMHDFCKINGIPVWIGTMPELGIGSLHSLNLCALDNCKFPTDVEASLRWYLDDVIEPLIMVKNGFVEVSEDFAFEINQKKIDRYTVKKIKIHC
ncbi:o-succinylbenzoate synthase [Candidatus Chrysopegis kryptomonas]|uniref:o-succinylbenzoate synthase n=1 Tax=Candidatus Chryseopegocella kryptomonas TaxID=1633643 RepID=A0A0P1MLV7_9BACT|nr:o-succinylbenzoate synthase [Candidatus Chrysopegis kryptomonas]CUS96337.1 O-succinylbenzoate synthase [Candidatus Chrysopegis kryptomonas]